MTLIPVDSLARRSSPPAVRLTPEARAKSAVARSTCGRNSSAPAEEPGRQSGSLDEACASSQRDTRLDLRPPPEKHRSDSDESTRDYAR